MGWKVGAGRDPLEVEGWEIKRLLKAGGFRYSSGGSEGYTLMRLIGGHRIAWHWGRSVDRAMGDALAQRQLEKIAACLTAGGQKVEILVGEIEVTAPPLPPRKLAG